MNNRLAKYTCWNVERVNEVINVEAVEMDSAAFMATHTPITGLQYESSDYEITDTSENGLLRQLIERGENNLHTFIVLKGIPGTGKSHLTRWLKERFDAYNKQNDDKEVILLIRRANSSLNSTIRQIIETGAFDAPIFQSYLDRLRDATTRLTDQELSNRILNGLQEAALAVHNGSYEPPVDRSFSRRITVDMPDFLLNISVREFLMRNEGGVKHIGEFLTGEKRSQGVGEEMPRFTADDLDFPEEISRDLARNENQKVVNLFRYLKTQTQDVVDYLNSLLNYAVSNLTSLTVDQLKAMFGELRRQLRKEGKNLTLFIEDITSFTGLDAGLIDVLIAQHGRENPDYCRLTSLIGVTDNYYEQYFRDNIRQRMTFLISLNAKQTEGDVSHLLQSAETVAEMAARYLNAIRLSEHTIQRWYTSGANPDDLENHCMSCKLRTECHAAFGTVSVGSAESNNTIGLYPFNKKALWNLYSHIDTNRTSRTPRALVNNILRYILHSHTDKIKQGIFPTSPTDLAPDVNPPNLRKVVQRRSIESQQFNKSIQNRIETLVRIWGDGTIDTDVQGEQIFIGQLPTQVFEIFNLPIIKTDSPPIKTATSISSKSTVSSTQSSVHPVAITTPPVSNTSKPKYTEDIEEWLNGGKLEGYQHLAKHLASFVKTVINWELYGVTKTQVDDRITQARFEIEGQAGQARAKLRFFFERSLELALVLHAIDATENIKNPSLEDAATHQWTLHNWLEKKQQELIDYVTRTETDKQLTTSYALAVTQSVYGLAILSGSMIKNRTSPPEILHQLVKFAASQDPFIALPNQISERHDRWKKVVSSLKDVGDQLRGEFLTLLNCPQGAQGDRIPVKYIDAARGIRLIEESLSVNELFSSGITLSDQIPVKALSIVYNKLEQELWNVLDDEMSDFSGLHQDLKNHDAISAEELFKAIESFVKFAQDIKYEFKPPENLSANELATIMEDLSEYQQTVEDRIGRIHLISGALQLKRDASKYLRYLKDVTTRLQKEEAQINSDLKSGKGPSLREKQNEILIQIQNLQNLTDRLMSGE